MKKVEFRTVMYLKLVIMGLPEQPSEAFLEAVTPEWAFISCGEDNRYGHPHDETLDRLQKAGMPVFNNG